MPFTRRPQHRDVDSRHDELVDALVQEINQGNKGTGPVIIEETVHASDRLHVYVVWDQWKGVSEEHRSAAILDAYREAPQLGEEAMRRILIAMGLTPQEADALGIKWRPAFESSNPQKAEETS